MTNKWLLTFLAVAIMIFSLGAFMQWSGDHKECVNIIEGGFTLLGGVLIWGAIFGMFRE